MVKLWTARILIRRKRRSLLLEDRSTALVPYCQWKTGDVRVKSYCEGDALNGKETFLEQLELICTLVVL